MARALVVGGGIFGVTAALELRARGLEVMLVDPGPIPHPLAESTDITKVLRADYGSDALYTRLMERSLEGWRDWNQPEALPELAEAATTSTRICVYGDTFDGDLWIAPDPAIPNRIVATGGSGHAFKFAPILGALIADACEGRVEPRFRWRPEVRAGAPSDAARHVDAPTPNREVRRPAD